MNRQMIVVGSRLFSVAECEGLGQVNKELELRYTLQSRRYFTKCANILFLS